MTPLVSITTVFVFLGACFLVAAISQGRAVHAAVPVELRGRWLTLAGLMLFFLASYVFLIVSLVTRVAFPVEMVAGVIFLAGALFVHLVVTLTAKTIAKTTAAEEELRQLNGLLEQRVGERTAELERSREFLRTVVDSLNDSVLIINVDDFTVSGVNRPFLAEYGRSSADVIGKKCHEITHNRSDVCAPPHDTCPLIETATTGKYARAEHVHFDTRGERKYVEVTTSPIVDGAGPVAQVVHISRDVTERKLKEDHFRNMALYDMLTGLPNRTLFFDRVTLLLELARRNQFVLAVLFIDLDHFKTVNDTLGHEAGDLLLKEVSERLTGCTRKADTLARVGGDEFVGICGKIEAPEDAMIVARKILDVLARPFQLKGHECRIGASIGISLYPDDGADAETLLSKADTAMYHVKQGKRGGYLLYRDVKPA